MPLLHLWTDKMWQLRAQFEEYDCAGVTFRPVSKLRITESYLVVKGSLKMFHSYLTERYAVVGKNHSHCSQI
jgi:hypothetical protein